jgi:hypothetical protein
MVGWKTESSSQVELAAKIPKCGVLLNVRVERGRVFLDSVLVSSVPRIRAEPDHGTHPQVFAKGA